MNKNIDLLELIKQCPGTTIHVGASELGIFAKQLIAESRREFERERAAVEAGNVEILRNPEEVKTILKISDSTLTRMIKSGVLETIWVSGLRRFRQSDLQRIIIGNKKA